jgi:adenine-specific DNA-methyltransferase
MARYRNPDEDPRGPWQSVSANVQDGHATSSQYYALVAPNGTTHNPPKGRCWIYNREKMEAEIRAGNVWFGKSGNGIPRLKRFLSAARLGLTPQTLWRAEEVGTTDEAKKQLLKMFPTSPLFDTPKPEGLISRIIQIATNEGDIVLDPFLGSGTTVAVAHKLRRSYIGIEQNPGAMSLSLRRLRLVIDGEMSGRSAQVGWVGGGGFESYRASD